MKPTWRVILTISTLLLGIGALGVFAIIPAMRDLLSFSTTIAQEQERLKQGLTGALRLQQTTKDLEKVTQALPQLQSMLIQEGREIELFTTLEAMSSRLALTETLRLGTPTAIGPLLRVLPVEIELRGNLAALLRFITDLERAPLVLPVETIRLTQSPTDKPDTASLTSVLKGMIYVIK